MRSPSSNLQILLPGQRLLVVDDDPDRAYLLQEDLNSQDLRIDVSRNRQEGLLMGEVPAPHAVLLDTLELQN